MFYYNKVVAYWFILYFIRFLCTYCKKCTQVGKKVIEYCSSASVVVFIGTAGVIVKS